ncbi:MAG: glycosyltransferase, partial [Candidatus Adiutrix sp.]|nr:glycosyltransferase [Candidatus Adiutrix sp.]
MNIAFISREVEGLNKNGGIGTATRYICEHLALSGHEIHLYHTGYPDGAIEDFHQCMSDHGIWVHYIHKDANIFYSHERRPYQVYIELRDTTHDIYIFHDYLADGFYCFIAKESGTAFPHAQLGLITHASSLWCDQANLQFPNSDQRLALYDMEKSCCELADFIVSPSAYMLEWAKNEGWKLPVNSQVIPNLTSEPGSFDPVHQQRSVLTAGDVRELVFFGRLEERKGVRVFCDAINSLSSELLSDRVVTFLGSECSYSKETISALLKPAQQLAQFELKFIDNFDTLQARNYLRKLGRVALMPSILDNSPCVIYECLENEIPFFASSTGGGRELVHFEDRNQVFFSPEKKELTSLLTRILTEESITAPRPSYTHDIIVEKWQKLFIDLQPAVEKCPAASDHISMPLVSLVLTHHDRPHLLKFALQSCLNQDYQPVEIILVDDGSETQTAKEYLDKLERMGKPHLKILRLKNRWLGAARNSGIEAASGEYIIFLDDDNIALPDMVSRYVAAAQYSRADAVSGMIRFFYDKKGLPGFNSENNQSYSFWGGHQYYTAMLINFLGDATGIYRTEMLKKAGGFHEHFGVAHEDWKMYIDIESIGGKIVTIPEMMFWYRVTDGSMIRVTNNYMNSMQHLSAYERRLPVEW